MKSEDIERMCVLKGGRGGGVYGCGGWKGGIVMRRKGGWVGKVKVEYKVCYRKEEMMLKKDEVEWEYGGGWKGGNGEEMGYGVGMEEIEEEG